MSRLIDVDALRKDFKVAEHCDDCPNFDGLCHTDVVFSRVDICHMLDDAEIVYGGPMRHGRWIDETCSICGQYVYSGDANNYCPKCGAKMDGDENAVD